MNRSICKISRKQLLVSLCMTAMVLPAAIQNTVSAQVASETNILTGDTAGDLEFRRATSPILINPNGLVGLRAILKTPSGGGHGGFVGAEFPINTFSTDAFGYTPTLPAFARYVSFGTPSVNQFGGDVVFQGDVEIHGIGTTLESSGVFYTNGTQNLNSRVSLAIAREEDAAQGLVDVQFASFGQPIINDNRNVVFAAGLQGPSITSSNNQGIFQTSISGSAVGPIDLLVRTGDVAPSSGGAVFTNFEDLLFSNSSHVVFEAGLGGAGVGVGNDTGWYAAQSGSPQLVVRNGSLVTGLGGAVINDVSGVSLNQIGTIVYKSSMSGGALDTTNDEAIFLGAPGSISIAVREGDAIQNLIGSTLRTLGNASLSNSDEIAFRSAFTGAEIGSGIFTRTTGLSNLVVRSGDSVPGFANATFDSFGSSDADPILNASGQIAFVNSFTITEEDGITTTTREGLFATDLAGAIRAIAVVGDTYDVNTDPFVEDNRMISSINGLVDGGGAHGSYGSFNDVGLLAFELRFTDDTFAVVTADTLSTVPTQVSGTLDAGVNQIAQALGGGDQKGGVTLLFDQVSEAGILSVNANPETDESEFSSIGSALAIWSVTFDGEFTGDVELTFGYDEGLLSSELDESELVVGHLKTNGELEELVGVIDTELNTITVTTTSFSDFAIVAVPEPTSGVMLALGTLGLLRRRRA